MLLAAPLRRASLALWLLLTAAVAAPASLAGQGPETTVVVVNVDSPTSLRVANAYVKARGIPATHVVELSGVPRLTTVDVDTFRTRLWGPVKEELAKRGLLDRTDVVAWSADFPYGVSFDADKGAKDLQSPITPIASLTSMTYLARLVEAKEADGYLSLTANGYYRRYPSDGPTGGRDMTDTEAALRNEALTLLTKKDWAGAASAYARLLVSWSSDPATHYDYACCLARAGRADEAVKALESALATGFADPAHTKADPDLESLRSRADFQAVLEKMEKAGEGAVQPSRAFHASDAWTGSADPATGDAAKDSTSRYRLSTMLGYTGEWGSSAPEVLDALERTIAADGTNPRGTFYFCSNPDVRATTRVPRFDAAVAALEALGFRAEVLKAGEAGQSGVVPVGKEDVLGACLGTAGFAWKDGKSRILPGGICEHLTSFGGVFDHGGQTKLTELIRAGAAGASGTVNEPYAIPHKFPAPHLYVHYAAGCSLAEAFYQSVWGPYQLLVVGDPLARPFAKFARVEAKFPLRAAGRVDIEARVRPADGRPIARVELWVDGAYVMEVAPGAVIVWNTFGFEDGAHDVRVVAVEAGPIETRSDVRGTTIVANGTVVATLLAPPSVPYDGTISLSGQATGADSVEVLAGARVVARAPVAAGAWKATLAPSRIGLGETTLQARALRTSGAPVRSGFREVTVVPPAFRKAIKGGRGTDGLSCTITKPDGKALPPVVLANLGGSGLDPVRKVLEASSPLKSVDIEGEFEVPTKGLYQWVANARGDLRIDVDGKPALEAPRAEPEKQAYGLVALEAGWHALRVRLTARGAPDLTVLLAGEVVTTPLQGKMLRHDR